MMYKSQFRKSDPYDWVRVTYRLTLQQLHNTSNLQFLTRVLWRHHLAPESGDKRIIGGRGGDGGESLERSERRQNWMRGTELNGLGGEEDTRREKKASPSCALQTGTAAALALSLTLMASGFSQSWSAGCVIKRSSGERVLIMRRLKETAVCAIVPLLLALCTTTTHAGKLV